MRKIRIGSRKSQLARIQTNEITSKFEVIEFEMIWLDTAGDLDRKTPIDLVEGSDFFADTIEKALIENTIDLAIHSAKDLPEKPAKGLEIALITESIDERDSLVSKGGKKLSELALGATVGTSSKRRKAQILKHRPDLMVSDLRGNIDDRLLMLDQGKYDAIIVAAAALKRLGQENRIAEYLPFETAKGQGSLALEIRSSDKELKEWLSKKFI